MRSIIILKIYLRLLERFKIALNRIFCDLGSLELPHFKLGLSHKPNFYIKVLNLH